MFKVQKIPLTISLSLAFIFAAMHLTIEAGVFEYGFLGKKGFLHSLELKALDTKFLGRTMDLPEPEVVVAAIDEKAVDRYGLWPWNRRVIADFVRKATEGGAKVIGFDAVFADKDKNSSYVSITSFAEDFKSGGLLPNGPVPTALKKASAKLRDTQASSAKVLAQLAAEVDKLPKRHRPEALKWIKSLKKVQKNEANWAAEIERVHGLLRKRTGDVWSSMQRQIASVSPDEDFADAVRSSPQTVLGVINFYNKSEAYQLGEERLEENFKLMEKVGVNKVYETKEIESGDQIFRAVRPVENISFENMQVRPVVGILAPLKPLAEAATSMGYFNVSPDKDGIFRRIRLLNRDDERFYPSLTLASLSKYFDEDIHPINSIIEPGIRLDKITIGTERDIPTDPHGRLMVNYYTDPAKYFPTYSVADIMDGATDPALYKDKVMLFGMTALAMFDLRATPFSGTTPGVYIHASAIQNVIDNKFLTRFFGMVVFEVMVYLLLGLFLGWLLPRVSVATGLLTTLALIVGWYIVDVNVLFPRGIWMTTVIPTLEVAFIFVGVSVYGYLTEGREKRKVRKAFQYYLTKSVVDEMLKSPDRLQLGGERRVCTVFFSDIRGFTTISEKLTPEELVHLLNSYLTPMTDIVFRYDGTLDKYMGDAIMAIFGAPVAHKDHAARACHASLDMMEELVKLQAMWRDEGLPEIDIGIGLNTGPMSVGNMGSEIRFDYTVMGDNVNLGSRLEGINKQYGTNIIVSESTREAAGEGIHTRELDSVRVKGKEEPVIIYELLGKNAATPQVAEMIQLFEQGIGAYKKQAWDDAITLFNKVRTDVKPDDFASSMYIDRCEAMKANPPGPEWDGVFTMTTK